MSWDGTLRVVGTYRAVFRAPGSAAFCAAAFVMRLPVAIYPIALVLIVSARTGQYGFAGVLAGVYVAANGLGNPVLARLTDRVGQRRALLPATVIHMIATIGLAIAIQTAQARWVLIAVTAVSGFFFLAVGSLVRARWSHAWGDTPELGTAFSLESTLDEVIFTTGPLIATFVATSIDPVVALLLGVLLVGTGGVWLRNLPGSQPPPHPHRAGGPPSRSVMRTPGMALITAGSVLLGVLFSSVDVTIVAFSSEQGHRTLTGAVLACVAVGSGIAGFFYGARRRAAPVLGRYLRHAVLLGILPVLLPFAPSIPVLAVVAFVVGLGVAPALITTSELIKQIVRPAVLTEGLAWMVTGLNLGYGAGSAMVGHVADAFGARSGFLISVAAGLLAAVVAVLVHARLSRMVPPLSPTRPRAASRELPATGSPT